MGVRNWKKIFKYVWKKEGNSFIQFLLDAGLEVNALNKYGTTMLSYAAEYGHLEIAEFLVQKGADANVANSDGSKPLHIAAQNCRKHIVKFFLDIGISVNTCDETESTPLHYIAVKSGLPSAGRDSYEELVHILVASGADLDAVNIRGFTPMQLAAKNRRKQLVELFIKLGANPECCYYNQWTVLNHACCNGWLGIVQTLIDRGVELDTKSSKGYDAPVIIAAEASHEDVVKLLIDSGADVKCKGVGSATMLHYACQRGWLEVVKILVSKGCDVNTKNYSGETPLLMAAEYSHSNIVDYLIECGAKVEVGNKDGYTFLHYACKEGWLDVAKCLVSKGCDLNAETYKGITPSLMAAQFKHSNVVEYLIECGADIEVYDKVFGYTLLHYACEKGWLEVAKCLVSKGCDLNGKDKLGRSPLLVAAQYSHYIIVEYLIKCGAHVKVCDNNGGTLLNYTCSKRWLEIVKLLIEKGCDVNARHFYQLETPLHSAVRLRGRLFSLGIVEALLDAGADCNAETSEGKTAFNYCIENSLSLEVITLFLNYGAYFQTDDYCVISKNSYLKENILRNTQLCTVALINKFNNADLCKMYEIPGVSEKLPSMEKMRITSRTIVAQDIAKSVQNEIQVKGYCNILSVRPIVLGYVY